MDVKKPDRQTRYPVVLFALFIAGTAVSTILSSCITERSTAMPEPKTAGYGSWKSPITSELITSETIGLGQVELDGGDVYWVEMRPSEAGRNIVVRCPFNGTPADVTPAPWNARTRVHEYGGGSYLARGGAVYFSHFTDQRLYRTSGDDAPVPITPEGDYRYADAVFDEARSRLVCVREDHGDPSREALNTIVAVDVKGEADVRILVSGHDFYSSPRISPDGSQLSWLAWNHPNMPWDGTELWLAGIGDDGDIVAPVKIAGGPSESIFQPSWSPGGDLYFVSDRTGWWNIYRIRSGAVEAVTSVEAEFGRPQWVFGISTYAFPSPDRIICTWTRNGDWRLALIDTETLELTGINLPYSAFGSVRASNGIAVFTAGSPDSFNAIVSLDFMTMRTKILKRSGTVDIDPGYISIPKAIEFPTEDGLTSHAFHYPPKNKDFRAPAGELPPLIVISHGGPTGATMKILRLVIQYWTSRGFAVVDVNYGGSSGYGREYRERLKGRWGIVDIDDCVNAALFLAEREQVDRDRLAIRGGSAGGFTTLAALTFRDVFKTGASHYGVSDLEALAKETHKFESRYLDSLIGPYPEKRDIYIERSPIHHTDLLSRPMILFQGLEDKIVPPNQAEMIVDALAKKGVPVAYLPFEGEQHGFRNAANIRRALDAELYFYSRVFGFTPADKIEPVEIINMK